MTIYERFLKYVSYPTTSDENNECCPSTAGQMVLAKELVKELLELGVGDARVDEHGYVYGSIPANCEGMPSIGFIAHMDTASDAPGENIKARMINYEGGDITLNEEEGIVLTLEDYPYVAEHKGERLIVTDGTTLLGADDKAGVAVIMTAVEKILSSDIKHGKICIGFTPDEEIGRGADLFDVEGFGAEFAYTLDGGGLGEIEYENFNAASAKITVKGVNIHPGSAKNRMKNAVLMANQLVSMMPASETPAHTEGYEGFYHIHDFVGNECETTVAMIIRDHDRDAFEARKAFLTRLVDYLNGEWGEGSFTLEMRDSYYNMKEKILPHMELIENAKVAMLSVGVEPTVIPIRGGTDGARLSYMGLPCPNLCTGGANFHGIHEFIPVRSMRKMVDILVCLMKR